MGGGTRFRAALATAVFALFSCVPARSAPAAITLGWNDLGSARAYIGQAAHAPGLNTVSPGWWLLRPNGSIADRSDGAYAAWAHAHGMRVWPMFANDIDARTSHRVLTTPTERADVIARVAALANKEGADGINVDWENLATADRDAFSAFVAAATAAWHAAGLVVSVDVTARTDTWQLGNWSESFDRAALSSSVDYVMLMAYDEHNRLRPNGPTASLPWVRDSVRYLLRTTPASKVVLGVPFYMYDWSNDPHRRMRLLTFADAPASLRAHHASQRWDDSLGVTVATYVRGPYTHRVWLEDARSLRLKAALVSEYGLAGVAAWRLGFATSEAWRAIAAPVQPATGAPAPRASAAPSATSPPRAATSLAAPVREHETVATRRSASVPLAAAAAAVAGAALGGGLAYSRRRRRRIAEPTN